jgi:hypothetical protein
MDSSSTGDRFPERKCTSQSRSQITNMGEKLWREKSEKMLNFADRSTKSLVSCYSIMIGGENKTSLVGFLGFN